MRTVHQARTPIRVSIVDDNVAYRSAMSLCLPQAEGINFVAAYADAASAYAGIQANPVDVLIADIQMPGTTGIELVAQLGELDLDTQYLICSSHSDTELVFSALKAGASGYILKDSTFDQVVVAIHELYAGGAPMSAFIARKVVANFQNKTARKFARLTPREQDTLQLLAQGLQYKEIADELGIAYQTVKIHIRNIYSKLHCHNKVEAINKYYSL